jgi:type I restriction enzyme R subunit
MFYDPDKKLTIHNHDLPHWQQNGVNVFITWRLADSIPQTLIKEWKIKRERWLEKRPQPWDDETEKEYHLTFSSQFENWLDQGLGSCVLRDQEVATIVSNCLLYDHEKKYELNSFVIMPNHVHILVQISDTPLEELMQTWKSVTSHRINKHLRKSGKLWQAKYWDRLVRNERHFFKSRNYIEKNPHKANLSEGDFIHWVK